MRDFETELKQALKNYVAQHYTQDGGEAECEEKVSDSTAQTIRNMLKQEEKTVKHSKIMKRWIGVLAACALLMCSGVIVYASSPAVREYLNMLFLKEDSMERLTEVPEGYTGIYTAEDLDRVREDMKGSYILMNDIMLTEEDYREGGIFEGGFEPIGSKTEKAFRGVFNGNGYVISGLVIHGDYSYAGLFGYVERLHQSKQKPVETVDGHGEMDIDGDGTPDEKFVYYEDEFRSVSGGIIKNLGVVNSTVTVNVGAGLQKEVYAGIIAGWADYIVGCYTDQSEISLTYATERSCYSVSVGGVAGGSYLTDSCYSLADITVNGAIDAEQVMISGVTGQTYAAVTSYFDGSIHSGSYASYGVTTPLVNRVPMVLSETIMQEIYTRLNPTDGEGTDENSEAPESMDWRRLIAFYFPSSDVGMDMDSSVYFFEPVDEILYFLDPYTTFREYGHLNNILAKAFPNDDFEVFCMKNNLKCGYHYCYDLREATDCTFEGFDTNRIWYMENGRPLLRLFSGGTVELNHTAPEERKRIGWQKGLFQTPIPGM